MLSVFPELLSFGLISPAIIRIAISIIGFKYGFSRYKKQTKWLSLFYIIVSIFLFIGLYTQVFVLIGLALIKIDYFLDKKYSDKKPNLGIYLFVSVVLLSLLFTGPGFLAFDLPL